MFDLCDRDANGFITKDELSGICQQSTDEDVASSVLDNVMLCLDSNHDGRISFEEFKAGFQVGCVHSKGTNSCCLCWSDQVNFLFESGLNLSKGGKFLEGI